MQCQGLWLFVIVFLDLLSELYLGHQFSLPFLLKAKRYIITRQIMMDDEIDCACENI